MTLRRRMKTQEVQAGPEIRLGRRSRFHLLAPGALWADCHWELRSWSWNSCKVAAGSCPSSRRLHHQINGRAPAVCRSGTENVKTSPGVSRFQPHNVPSIDILLEYFHRSNRLSMGV